MPEPSEIPDRILDAAGSVFAELGLRKARMGNVAEAAGCSRATLYRYFADKDALVAAYAMRELDRTAARVSERVRGVERLGDRIVEAMATAIEAVRSSEAVRPFLAPEAQGLTSALPSRAEAMGPRLATLFAELLSGHDGSEQLRPDLPKEEALEWAVRMVLSLSLVPGPTREAAALRAFLARWVRPALVVPCGE